MSSKWKRAAILRYNDAHQGLGDCQVGYNGWQPQRSELSVVSGRTQTAHSRDDSMRTRYRGDYACD